MSSTMRFAIIGLMLLTVGVLGMIVINMNRSAPVQIAQTPAPLLIKQLVTARPIPAGTLIRDEDLTVKSLPSAEVVGLTDTPDNRLNLRGSLLRRFIESGMPITMADVIQPRDRGFIASVLHDGARAVAIAVDQVSGVAGLIWPGDHVDILLTQEMGDAPKARKSLGETVLTDVRIIAIDQDMVQSAPSNNSVAGKVVRTVTVEVTPVQAQKLAVAAIMGKLSFTVRSAIDQPSVTPGTIYAGDVSPALSQDAPVPSGAAMLVINGKDHTEVKFK